MRWTVVITLTTGETEKLLIEELSELHDLVERGPDWRLIADIKITYNLNSAMHPAHTSPALSALDAEPERA